MSNNKNWLERIPQHAIDYIGRNKIEEIQSEIEKSKKLESEAA